MGPSDTVSEYFVLSVFQGQTFDKVIIIFFSAEKIFVYLGGW